QAWTGSGAIVTGQPRVLRPSCVQPVRGRDGSTAQRSVRAGMGGGTRDLEAIAATPHQRLRGTRRPGDEVWCFYGQERHLQRAVSFGRTSTQDPALHHACGGVAWRCESVRLRTTSPDGSGPAPEADRLATYAAVA